MTRDEIKNKIQLETTNVKNIVNKRRWIESKKKQLKARFDFLHGLHTNPRRKRRKIKKKKPFSAEPRRTTIHAPYKEKEDAETNPMMRRKRQYKHQSQPYVSLEVNEAADALAGALHASTNFLVFFLIE
jgi:hypothetical protein